MTERNALAIRLWVITGASGRGDDAIGRFVEDAEPADLAPWLQTLGDEPLLKRPPRRSCFPVMRAGAVSAEASADAADAETIERIRAALHVAGPALHLPPAPDESIGAHELLARTRVFLNEVDRPTRRRRDDPAG